MNLKSFPKRAPASLQLIRSTGGSVPSAVAIGVLAVVAFFFVSVGSIAQVSASKTKETKWKLVWSEEFNGPKGSAVDQSKWVFDIGAKTWGNEELESYTNRPENVAIQDGNLVIQARQENYTGSDGIKVNYTSARLNTLGKFSQTYGRFEARIKVPFVQDLCSAFWMLGDNIEKAQWPDCGDIDIMATIWHETSILHVSIYMPV